MIAAKTRRPLVLGSVMVAAFMIAIEATIVSTAMPQIVSRLGNFQLYAWVFSSFLLAQTASVVVFGKLSDCYGRKPIMFIGMAIFLLGSLLCGFAWSMPSLIVFRLVQGLGAGAISPVNLTLVGDMYTGRERGQVQGYLASVWGVSSLLGPLAGGLIIQHVYWGWIFWINIPVGIAATIGFWLFLHEDVRHEQRSIDYAGAGLFTAAIVALMLGLTDMGAGATPVLLATCVFALSTVLFIRRERRAPDPMVATGLWARRSIATLNAVTLLSGMSVIGLTTFLPMYVQGVLGRSPLVAGFTLTAMVFGWPVSATIGARNFHRFGLRNTLLAGAVLLPLGAAVFVVLGPGMSPLVAGAGSLVMGFGMGLLSTAAIVMIQGSVEWAERGSATASNMFSRNLGSTLGAAVFGAVLNLTFGHSGGGVTADSIRTLLGEHGASAALLSTRDALARGLHATFWAMLVVAIGLLMLAFAVPRSEPQPAS